MEVGVPRIRVLGPLAASLGDSSVDLGGPRQRAVLALLVAARGSVVSVDHLIDDLWHGEPPARAIGGLQAYISNLRRALEPTRPPRAPATILVSAAPGYALRVPRQAVDAWLFEDVVRDGSTSTPTERAVRLRAALALWHGSAVAEFADQPWAQPEAARLEELRLVAREQLVTAELDAGEAAQAVLDADSLVSDAPLREEPWRLLALAQYAADRQGDALATLRRARKVLADELGVDPGARLRELEQAVRAQSVVLTMRPPTTPAPEPAAARTPQQRFVNRHDEVAQLDGAAAAARSGGTVVALVSGEAGAGKSALLDWFAHRLIDTGWLVARGRCPELEGAPPAWGCAEALRDLATQVEPGSMRDALAPLLTERLDVISPDAVGGRFQLHRAVAEWLAALTERPLAIVLDDVHRADAETRRLITTLADASTGAGFLLLLGYRPESGEQLDELLATLAPREPVRVRVGGLDRSHAGELAEAVLGEPLPDSVLDAVFDRTDGNPFFVTELARLVGSEGAQTATTAVPEGVADTIRRRLSRLPDEAVTVLRLASVIGRAVDVSVLIRAAAQSEEAVLDALEAGVLSGLLVDDRAGAVSFSHVLIRDTLYAAIPRVRRTAWHAAIASALAEVHPADVAALAHHAVQSAVAATGQQAARYAIAAAEQAEARYSHDVAATLYEQALGCLELAGAPGSERVAVLMRLLPELLNAANQGGVYRWRPQLVRLARSTGDDGLLARALTACVVPSTWAQRSYGRVDAEFVGALEHVLLVGELTSRERCLLLGLLARETAFRDDPRTLPASDESLALARALDDPELLAWSLFTRCEVLLPDLDGADHDAARTALGELADRHELAQYRLIVAIREAESALLRGAVDACRAALDVADPLARKLQLELAIGRVAIHTGTLAHITGDPETAEAMYRDGMGRYHRAGGVEAETVLQFAVTSLRMSQGRLAECVDALTAIRAVSLAAGVPNYSAGLLALALLDAGDVAGARAVLTELPVRARDLMWSTWTSWLGLALAQLGDPRCTSLYDDLLPLRGQIAGPAAILAVAPVDRILGLLAAALGRPDDARRHLTAARELARRCGNELWTGLIDADLAAVDAGT